MRIPLRVLQVEDSESDAGLILRYMERAGYEVESRRVEDAAEMRAALQQEAWDVVISDHQMSQFDAPAALRILQDSGQDIPFLVVSGNIGEELAVALMKSGAHDYVLKNNLSRLAPAVEREIREARTRVERRAAEAELRETQERLALAVDATQLGMHGWNLHRGTLVMSDATLRHFGISKGWKMGEDPFGDFLQLLHPEDRGRIAALAQGIRPGAGARYSAEFRVMGKEDGLERHLSLWGRAFFDDEGKPIRYIGVTQDTTGQKHLEEQLRQSQKLESIGRLAGGVAHDFNNLLTIITGYAEMALSDIGPDHPLRDALVEISDAAARAGSLTRQLLAFSRRQVVQPKRIVINELVRNFEKMLKRLLGEEIELILHMDPENGAIMADRGQLEQIVMNLAVNARDAMPKGGRLVLETASILADTELCQTHLSLKPGPYVMLSVSDTGLGMTDEVKAHIFEPFFTTKEPGKGTGLGLSTVWGIVNQSGGTIWVNSEPGRGTTFKVLFPAAEPSIEDVHPMTASDVLGGTETILLAEDEVAVRKYTRHILEKHGYTVLAASDGREALRVAREHPGTIDLLITDVVMPHLGGAELAIAFTKSHPKARVVCISGYSDRLWPVEQVRRSYVQKPFAPAALLREVRAVLDAEDPEAESAKPAL